MEPPPNEHPESRRRRKLQEYFDLVEQTADLRYRRRWRGARELIAGQKLDPSDVILLTCQQGEDINVDLVIPGGKAICCDFTEDPQTRQAISIFRWDEVANEPDCDNDYALAYEIVTKPNLKYAFDCAVLAFFDFHWRDNDEPLPGGTA